MSVLDASVDTLSSVGSHRYADLRRAGIETVGDLVRRHRPFRYEDRSRFVPISQINPEQPALIQARVLASGNRMTPRKRMKIFELKAGDDSATIAVKFFNQPYLSNVFRKGSQVVFFGVPKIDDYSRELTLLSPEYEVLEGDGEATIHTGRIVPIYKRIGSIQTRFLRQLIYSILESIGPDEIEEVLPEILLKRYRLPSRWEALRQIHFPEADGEDPAGLIASLESSTSAAHRRLIFEEFFRFNLGLLIVKSKRELVPKQRTIRLNDQIRQSLKSILPFRPTNAQKRVLKEIVEDLASTRVMHRLVQGDVGSGKTIVALQAMLVAVENGLQTVLMAPTELLAEQHLQTVQGLLKERPYRVTFLTGSVKGKERKSALAQIAGGKTQIAVGTHAVFQEGVDFQNLGLVVIDEQHRFGVLQRSSLMEKGDRPDTLVMTATPIPRTLALTLYGDLDFSVIDELPPGRQPVTTLLRGSAKRQEVYDGIRRQLMQGRQAYVVYPLVEESEKVQLRAATEMAAHLQEKVFPEFKIGLLHGRLKSNEKEELMRSFGDGTVHVLVSTTVIEVGIDVPNATLMIIEHADRFGLSQLHQLRGRIGRGPHPGYCVLMVEGSVSADAQERLGILRRSNDGFKIAEKDLELRGPGEFLGTRQSGLPGFLFANIVRDRKLLQAARVEAENYLAQLLDSGVANEANLGRLVERWSREFGLSTVA